MTATPDVRPESPSQVEVYARPGLALVIAGAGVVASVLLTAGYPVLRTNWMASPGWVLALVDLVVLSLPLVVAVGAAIAVASHRGLTATLGIRSWRWTDAALGLGIGLTARAAVELITPTTGSLSGPFDDGSAPFVATAVIAAIGVVLVSPLVEESFFRGLLTRAMDDMLQPLGRLPAAGVAVLVSTAVFVALHALSYGAAVPVALIVGTAGIGLGTGILVVVTGRLGGAIVAHIIFNTLGVLLLLQ